MWSAEGMSQHLAAGVTSNAFSQQRQAGGLQADSPSKYKFEKFFKTLLLTFARLGSPVA